MWVKDIVWNQRESIWFDNISESTFIAMDNSLDSKKLIVAVRVRLNAAKTYANTNEEQDASNDRMNNSLGRSKQT